MDTCKSCGARVIFAVHVRTGKPAPIDAEAHPDGSAVLMPPNMFNEVPYRILGAAERMQPATEPRHRPHYQTCPNARDYRNRGGAE